MTKELEALEELKVVLKTNPGTERYSDIFETSLIKPIETALKRLENYEKNEDFSKDVINYAFLSEKDKIKKLKALEIIKEKEVSIADFIYACMCSEKDLKEYHNCDNNYEFAATCVGWGKDYLTKEEYDILKEVLQ